MTAQMIHCWISPHGHTTGFYCTIVYAFNSAVERDTLWKDLRLVNVVNKSWIVVGDFNCVLSREERIGNPVRENEMAPFRSCLAQCQLEDIKCSGCFYTWNNKNEGQDRVYSKQDRVLGNVMCNEEFQNSEAHFLPEGIFDHSPILIKAYNQMESGKRPFKYFHMWSTAEDFAMRVRKTWSTQITGCAMYRVVKKMKLVKESLKELNNSGFDQIQAQEIRALKELKVIQTALHQDPRNDNLIIGEKRAASTYRKLAERHHSFLKQKARLEWMRCGDENTRVFHQAIKARRLQNTVYGITDSNGRWVDSQEQVNDAFLQYYIKLLGTERSSRRRI
ncbi:uncharacterized protein LOC125494123 [Beta vulgaris subsp. vulgaris]|uniref:uncharacterized protein LOC125494123 n=1 Tax=Beta vulgaris subsp. vulgaris TaxID=3555 RepID=UPI0020371417|nr:uncharacterized protein LOC125494123 [Beta vulgaris subsp. vulgaris]